MRSYFSKFESSRGLAPSPNNRYFLKPKAFGCCSAGFTLIEILVVASLIVFTTGVVIRNFVGSRLNLERVANIMVSDIRLAQQLALSSHQFKGESDPSPRNRCGYGITNKPNDNGDPDNDRKYAIYAGPPTLDAGDLPVSCSPVTPYQSNTNFPFYKSTVLDSRIDFVVNPSRFLDIFYTPPDPKTFIENGGVMSSVPSDLAVPTTYYQQITIKKVGVTNTECQAGNKDCIFICVYFSGRVEVSKSPTCPDPF